MKRTGAWIQHMADHGKTVDVWLCIECGLAFPFGHGDLARWHGTQFHKTCQHASGDGPGAQMKHVGAMSPQAARTLCGPRVGMAPLAAPPRAAPPALVASIGERVKVAPALAVVAPVAKAAPAASVPASASAATCVSCGEPLVGGACPMNTPDWPHVVTAAG